MVLIINRKDVKFTLWTHSFLQTMPLSTFPSYFFHADIQRVNY